jgi:hypothetical protein
MKIFTEIKDSIYNPNFYKALPLSRTLGSSIKYLAKLSLLVALVSLIILSFKIPGFYREVKSAITSFTTSYPEDMTLSVKDGIASTNRTEPYIIPVSQFASTDNLENKENSDRENLLVVDTSKSFSVEDFDKYSTYAWITKTELVMVKNSSSDQIQIAPFSKMGKWEINKAWILDKQTIILKILPWMIPIYILLSYIYFFSINFFVTLISLFFHAFIIWLMSKVKKVELSYKNSYKIGIHTQTLFIIILGPLINTFFLFVLYNFFVKLAILMIVVYVNFFKDSTSTPESEVVIKEIP